MGSQRGTDDGLNMQERLDQIANISEDAFAEYFLKHIKDIFNIKKSCVIKLLEDRDKATINTIRNTLLIRIGELHEGYRSKTPIKRQNMNKAHEDIFILGYNWLNPRQVSKNLRTVYREESKTVLSQSVMEVMVPIQNIQNNDDVVFPDLPAFDPLRNDAMNADVTKLRQDLDEITIDMRQTKTNMQEQNSQQDLSFTKLDAEISRLNAEISRIDKEHEWIMTNINKYDAQIHHYFGNLETYIKGAINDEVAKAVTQQTAAQGGEILRLNADVDRLQNVIHSLKPPTPPTTPNNPHATSTPKQQNKVIGLPTSNPPQQANNRSAWLYKAGSATAHGGNMLTQHTSPPTIPSKTALPRAQKLTNRENGSQQQSPQQTQNHPNGIKRGPKKVDQIFISQVGPSYNCDTLKDHIHDNTGIVKELISVEFLFNKNCNQAFKITVPHGKMQDTIRIMGTEIKAELYKEKSQARGAWSTNAHRKNNKNTFQGPPPNRSPPPNRQPNQRPYHPNSREEYQYQYTPTRRGFNQRQQYYEPCEYNRLPERYENRYGEPHPGDRYYQNHYRH